MKEPIYNLEKLLASLSFLQDRVKDIKDNYYELSPESLKELKQITNGSLKTVKDILNLFTDFF